MGEYVVWLTGGRSGIPSSASPASWQPSSLFQSVPARWEGVTLGPLPVCQLPPSRSRAVSSRPTSRGTMENAIGAGPACLSATVGGHSARVVPMCPLDQGKPHRIPCRVVSCHFRSLSLCLSPFSPPSPAPRPSCLLLTSPKPATVSS